MFSEDDVKFAFVPSLKEIVKIEKKVRKHKNGFTLTRATALSCRTSTISSVSDNYNTKIKRV